MPGPEPPEPDSLARVILRRHMGQVNAVAFVPDGRTLASGSLNGGITLWDAATGHPRAALPKGPGCITALAFAHDGRAPAWNWNGPAATVTVWDVGGGRARAALGGHSGRIRSVAFAADGEVLAAGGTDAPCDSGACHPGRRLAKCELAEADHVPWLADWRLAQGLDGVTGAGRYPASGQEVTHGERPLALDGPMVRRRVIPCPAEFAKYF
jgi:hypothetical protein